MISSERKIIEILKILSEQKEPVGAKFIADQLKKRGIYLTEPTVRYYLRILDERGLTKNYGLRGRVITEKGLKEIEKGDIADRIGYSISRVHECVFYSNFDVESGEGKVVANLAIFPREYLDEVLDMFYRCWRKGLTFSNKVIVDENIPFIEENEVGMYYISSFTLDAVLYRNGIVSLPRFAGSIEISNFNFVRFTQVIGLEESSITALDLFIQRMYSDKDEESISNLLERGEGEVYGMYREIPFVAREKTIEILEKLREYGISPLHVIGELDKSVCGIPPKGVNKVGLVCVGPSTPVGILRALKVPIRVHISSEIIEFSKFKSLESYLEVKSYE